ncbi:hypothetical protein HK101_006836 [Irineochytrium annulatum]|nr:hypothetical protein HK101_006836 [Irineochytrium annulatum]
MSQPSFRPTVAPIGFAQRPPLPVMGQGQRSYANHPSLKGQPQQQQPYGQWIGGLQYLQPPSFQQSQQQPMPPRHGSQGFQYSHPQPIRPPVMSAQQKKGAEAVTRAIGKMEMECQKMTIRTESRSSVDTAVSFGESELHSPTSPDRGSSLASLLSPTLTPMTPPMSHATVPALRSMSTPAAGVIGSPITATSSPHLARRSSTVRFHESVEVEMTYSRAEYDRTPPPTEPLTTADIAQHVLFRSTLPLTPATTPTIKPATLTKRPQPSALDNAASAPRSTRRASISAPQQPVSIQDDVIARLVISASRCARDAVAGVPAFVSVGGGEELWEENEEGALSAGGCGVEGGSLPFWV